MRSSFMIAVAVGAATLATVGAQAAPKTAQERMDKALAGRVAGAPVDCIQQNAIQSSQIIDGTAILYTVGRTIYVNAPRSGANFLRSGDILVTDTHSPQLCSIDMVRLVDQSARMPSGSVGLDKFIPYTKPTR